MNKSRTVKRPRAVAHGLVLTAMAVFFVIAGLLGMHTLSSDHAMGLPMAASAVRTEMTAVEADHPATSSDVTMDTGTTAAGQGATDSDTTTASVPMQNAPMAMAMCVLALLSAATLLLLPLFVAWFRTARPIAAPGTRTDRAPLPFPRPPSLLVLSISRT